MDNVNIDVKKEDYYYCVCGAEKFIYYGYKIERTMELSPKKILEIGIGNKVYYNYLKGAGYNIKSCDVNKELKPDYLQDIRKMKFKDNSFDLISAFEVMEHIPFSEFYKVLSNMRRITRKHIMLSIPEQRTGIDVIIKMPLMNRIIGQRFLRIGISKTKKTKNIDNVPSKDNQMHYWEIGTIDYPFSRISNIIEMCGLKIIRNENTIMNLNNRFLILEKKEEDKHGKKKRTGTN